MEQQLVHAKVFRSEIGNETKKARSSFTVPYGEAMTIQTLLRYIHENLDPTLAFRDFRCGRGVCNTCRIKVNGKVIRSCETPIQAGAEILLEPLNDRVIKDLVVAFD
jgi:succinate dehydrogenase / fumarate reductase iron-sulfur subunit